LAVTDAAPLSVNVQVFALFPPLEQAPDQMASRPLETLSVIDVPVANEADPVLPTATLIPAGLDVTRSPLRPVTVAVNVAVPPGGGGCGVTVRVAVLVTPPKLAVIVTGVEAITDFDVAVKVALVAPAETVTLAGTVAAELLLLESVTTAPPEAAATVRVTVSCEVLPPTTDGGLSETAESVGELVVADCTVNSRVTDHGPDVPAELIPRTRHQSLRAESELVVYCDGVTAWLRTSGVEKELASSI
jgi:hypothetical protein